MLSFVFVGYFADFLYTSSPIKSKEKKSPIIDRRLNITNKSEENLPS